MKTKDSSKLRRVDISPDVVARRLRELSALHRLGMSLKRARWIGKVQDIRRQEALEAQRDGDGAH